uniref:PR domain zinc finger protein 8 n=1 Tax=Anser cygnoides TaxID=8845 RepID=A0A8B9EAA7_ANSCY
MEDAGVQRGLWDGDAKTVQQCLTDIFTSVYTTCDIPENAIFGPCVLSHTSLYDSIAFIALKSTDKRTVPYIFRVDTSAANGSAEGLMWLRLVQSAREREEQNLEAYIKSGQLFYRSLRRIAKDEELLVWYGKELTELLLLGPARAPARANGGCPSPRPPSFPPPSLSPTAGGEGTAGPGGGPGPSSPPRPPWPRGGGHADCPPCPPPRPPVSPLRLAALRVPRVQPALPVRAALRRPPAVPLPQEAARRRHRPRRAPRRQGGRWQGAGGRQVLQAGRAAPPPLPRRHRRHQALHGLPQPGEGAGKLPRRPRLRRLPGEAGAPRRRPRGGRGQGEAALPRRRGAGPLPDGAAGAAVGAQGGAGVHPAAAAAVPGGRLLLRPGGGGPPLRAPQPRDGRGQAQRLRRGEEGGPRPRARRHGRGGPGARFSPGDGHGGARARRRGA